MKSRSGIQVRLRIHVGEKDKSGRRPLWRELLELLRGEGLAGATVLRGMSGFGATSKIHGADLLRLSRDLPIVIEAVDSREAIDGVLPLLAEKLDGGLVTWEEVNVLHCAADAVTEEKD